MKGDIWHRQWKDKPWVTVHQLSRHSFRAKVKGRTPFTWATITATTRKQAIARARWLRTSGPGAAFR